MITPTDNHYDEKINFLVDEVDKISADIEDVTKELNEFIDRNNEWSEAYNALVDDYKEKMGRVRSTLAALCICISLLAIALIVHML